MAKTEAQLRQEQIDRNFSIKDRIAVLKWIMENPMGRQFIWWLLSHTKIFSSTLHEHHVMAFNEGKRFVGLKVFELIQSDEECETLFIQAKKEHREQKN